MKSKKVEKHVTELYQKSEVKLLYHDINHTRIIVKMIEDACESLNINGEDKLILLTAAWFHDTGYLKDYMNHEEESVKIFMTFAEREKKTGRLVKKIKGCIEATKIENEPKSNIEAILKDIDIAYVLYTDFESESEKLRKEKEKMTGGKLRKEEWAISQQTFLKQIKFSSEYGRHKFSELLNYEKTKK